MLWVGWQCMIVVILTNVLDVCGDTELTKVASGTSCDFYSVMPDHKEASARLKRHLIGTSDVEYKRFCICCKNTDALVLK